MAIPEPGVRRIARFSLTSANADRLSIFYESALGFRRVSTRQLSAAESEALTGVRGGALRLALQLGREIVETPAIPLDRPPLPCPGNRRRYHSATFRNRGCAYGRRVPAIAIGASWTPISAGGPQQLPQSSGGVTAFKFRDPEGHPLELLAFPEHFTPVRWAALEPTDLFLGIDHSAICVRDTARTRDFYRGLGFRVSAHTVNHGSEQERLDGLLRAHVEVTALAPPDFGPHLE